MSFLFYIESQGVFGKKQLQNPNVAKPLRMSLKRKKYKYVPESAPVAHVLMH